MTNGVQSIANKQIGVTKVHTSSLTDYTMLEKDIELWLNDDYGNIQKLLIEAGTPAKLIPDTVTTTESRRDSTDLKLSLVLNNRRNRATELTERSSRIQSLIDSPDDSSGEDWPQILDRMKNSVDDVAYQRSIIKAEGLPVPEDKRAEVATALRKFIDANRDSNDLKTIVAVGSGIRKYVSLLDVQNLNNLVSLLESGHNASFSAETEIELLKMIGRKFAANPPAVNDPEPELAARLAEMAESYLKADVVSKYKFATIAMLAVEALAAMQSLQVLDLLPMINNCNEGWIRQQLRRQLTLIEDQQVQKGSSGDVIQRVLAGMDGH